MTLSQVLSPYPEHTVCSTLFFGIARIKQTEHLMTYSCGAYAHTHMHTLTQVTSVNSSRTMFQCWLVGIGKNEREKWAKFDYNVNKTPTSTYTTNLNKRHAALSSAPLPVRTQNHMHMHAFSQNKTYERDAFAQAGRNGGGSASERDGEKTALNKTNKKKTKNTNTTTTTPTDILMSTRRVVINSKRRSILCKCMCVARTHILHCARMPAYGLQQ